jgi:hypothetical protein
MRPTPAVEKMKEVGLEGVPTLRITDVQGAKRFYGEFLGSELDWEHY